METTYLISWQSVLIIFITCTLNLILLGWLNKKEWDWQDMKHDMEARNVYENLVGKYQNVS
jgi:hypothetical protein